MNNKQKIIKRPLSLGLDQLFGMGQIIASLQSRNQR